MNQIIITEEDIQKDREKQEILRLLPHDYRFIHLQNILHKRSGDHIRLTLINQGLGEGKILKISEKGALITLPSSWEIPKEGKHIPDIHLCIGLSRPPTMKKILEHATSMGVSRFSFFKAKLSEKSYLESKIWQERELNHLLSLGLSQSKCFYKKPIVSLYKSLSEIEVKEDHSFVLDPQGLSFSDKKVKSKILESSSLCLYLGPERGFVEDEIEFLCHSHGCQKIKISQSILRVEMAVFYSMAQVEMIFLK